MRRRVAFDDEPYARATKGYDVLEVHEVLKRLEGFDPELHQLVELRFFGGLAQGDRRGDRHAAADGRAALYAGPRSVGSRGTTLRTSQRIAFRPRIDRPNRAGAHTGGRH